MVILVGKGTLSVSRGCRNMVFEAHNKKMKCVLRAHICSIGIQNLEICLVWLEWVTLSVSWGWRIVNFVGSWLESEMRIKGLYRWFWFSYGCILCIQASHALDLIVALVQYMAGGHILLLPREDGHKALDDISQGEVFDSFTFSYILVWHCFLFLSFCGFFSNVSLLVSCRLMFRLFPTAFDLFLRRIQMKSSSRFGDRRSKTLTPSFSGCDSSLLGSLVSLFHCVACGVFLLFGQSTTLMFLVWRMSSSWDTVMVTELCTSLYITTLMRSFMSPRMSSPPGVHYGKRPMQSLMPFSKKKPQPC